MCAAKGQTLSAHRFVASPPSIPHLKITGCDFKGSCSSRPAGPRDGADSGLRDDLNRKAEPEEPVPDLVNQGYYLLGYDWRETLRAWRAKGHRVPPVMVTVANRSETAARVRYGFDHGKIRIEEL